MLQKHNPTTMRGRVGGEESVGGVWLAPGEGGRGGFGALEINQNEMSYG